MRRPRPEKSRSVCCSGRRGLYKQADRQNDGHYGVDGKMPLLHLLLGDYLCEFGSRSRPETLFHQHFGMGIPGEDLCPERNLAPILSGYYRPWRHVAAHHTGSSSIGSDQDAFKVQLDVQQFKPDEISVKMAADFVVIEGKHEERRDEHGSVARWFRRRYAVPADVDPDALTCKLSSDGVLLIEAPKKPSSPLPSKERVVAITRTNAPAVTPAAKPPAAAATPAIDATKEGQPEP